MTLQDIADAVARYMSKTGHEPALIVVNDRDYAGLRAEWTLLRRFDERVSVCGCLVERSGQVPDGGAIFVEPQRRLS